MPELQKPIVVDFLTGEFFCAQPKATWSDTDEIGGFWGTIDLASCSYPTQRYFLPCWPNSCYTICIHHDLNDSRDLYDIGRPWQTTLHSPIVYVRWTTVEPCHAWHSFLTPMAVSTSSKGFLVLDVPGLYILDERWTLIFELVLADIWRLTETHWALSQSHETERSSPKSTQCTDVSWGALN